MWLLLPGLLGLCTERSCVPAVHFQYGRFLLGINFGTPAHWIQNQLGPKSRIRILTVLIHTDIREIKNTQASKLGVKFLIKGLHNWLSKLTPQTHIVPEHFVHVCQPRRIRYKDRKILEICSPATLVSAATNNKETISNMMEVKYQSPGLFFDCHTHKRYMCSCTHISKSCTQMHATYTCINTYRIATDINEVHTRKIVHYDQM